MKTIFITGASTGLGKAAAILFHQKGWKVIATMRQPDQATALLITIVNHDNKQQRTFFNAPCCLFNGSARIHG